MAFFDKKKNDNNFNIKYFDRHLNEDIVALADGYDSVYVFVNDIINVQVIDNLYQYKVKLIALRCAGYNNVDLKAAKGKIKIVRVPTHSPHAISGTYP